MVVDEKEEVRIEPTGWTAQVSQDLSQCCNEQLLNFWYEQIYTGKSFVFEIQTPGKRLGSVVVTLEDGEMLLGPMGVTDYAVCFEAITPKMYELAETHGVKTVRVNADRLAIQKFLEPHDFELAYYSFVKQMGEK
jgi:hypothetical protein